MSLWDTLSKNVTASDAPEITLKQTGNEPQEKGKLDDLLKHESTATLKPGDIIEGKIVARKTAAVFVDLGASGTGIIFGREFFLTQNILKQHNIGDTIQAKIVDPENTDGYVELSVSEAGKEIAGEELRQALEEKSTVEVVVEGANRGGLMATLKGTKAFLPVSQLTPEHYPHVEGGDKEQILTALRSFVGKTLRVKVITFEPRAEKLILSERAVLEEELREEMKNFHIGDSVECTVSGVVDFGIFVRFGPDNKFEGLIHSSEISWVPVLNIQTAFKTGQQLKAKILDIQSDRVSLSLKALEPNPWTEAQDRFAVKQMVQGTFVRSLSSGSVIVQIAPGIQGVVRVPPKELREGQEAKLTITLFEPKEQRLELEAADTPIQQEIEKTESSAPEEVGPKSEN